MDQFSVIIPTLNRVISLHELITYLTLQLKWEQNFIIVNQNPRDSGALAEIRDNPVNSKHLFILNSSTRGASIARNLGCLNTTSEWILFLDDDIRPAFGYLEILKNFIDSHPHVDAIQTNLFQKEDWDTYSLDPIKWLDIYKKNQDQERKRPSTCVDGIQWFLSQSISHYPTYTLGIGSGTFAIKRQVFLDVGGFDENFLGIGEDKELGLRLWWLGYHVQYLPECIAFHLHDPIGGLRSNNSRKLFRPEPDPGLLYLYLKWFPGQPLNLFVWSLIQRFLHFPFTMPIKLLRLKRSYERAKKLIKSGPKYIENRVPISKAESSLK
jgi:GT2 family glycosyltransferase